MQIAPSYPRRVFLVGPMGVGKTTIGKKLAKDLGLRFIDSDQEIEDRIPSVYEFSNGYVAEQEASYN